MTKNNVVYLKDRKFQWISTEATLLGMTFCTNKEIYSKQIKNIFRIYKKNYAPPKLVYVLSSLPDRAKQPIKQIETIMYYFLWDSKPAKIKREILIMDHVKEGLKLIDLEIFIKSLKYVG